MIFENEKSNWKEACKASPNITQISESLKKRKKYKKLFCPRAIDDEFVFDIKNDFLNNWYFSRQTFGWYCGLHVDYTTMQVCSNEIKRLNSFLGNIYYVTILREPVRRYISEWNHLKRGGHAWNRSLNFCNKENFLNKCLTRNEKIEKISLEDFISCEVNIGNNRQTRMLADYGKDLDCSLFKEEKRRKLLENAKNILNQLSFFALNEFQHESQLLFEKTFKNQFKFKFKREQSKNETASELVKNVNRSIFDRIVKLNDLGLELYEYAKKLFFKRLNLYKVNY